MSQTVLTSEALETNREKSLEPNVLSNSSKSVVLSFSKPQVFRLSGSKCPDVRLSFSNGEKVNVSIYIDDSGEIDTRIQKLDAIRPDLEIPEKTSSQITRRRGRPKGSKNKPKAIRDDNHSIVKEMFETNEEFKRRQAEELRLLK